MFFPSWVEFFNSRRKLSYAFACALLFVICLARYRVAFEVGDAVPRDPESFRLAHEIYDHHRFANPFVALDTGPSAHLSPVFPAFVALTMRVFGDRGAGLYAVELAAALIVSLQIALFPVFSELLGMGMNNGIVGALVWIVARPKLVYGWEGLYAALLVAFTCCCFRLYTGRPPQQTRSLIWLLGFLMGFLVFVTPTMAPVCAVWLVWVVWQRKAATLKQILPPLLLLPILVVTPWTIRNYEVFHRLMLIRDDLGLELAVSNNDCARYAVRINLDTGCFERFHPNLNPDEAAKVRDLGEAKYNSLRLREALHWIGSHPVRFTKLTVKRFIAFWFPTETFTVHYASGRFLERSIIYLMTLSSVLGLVILYRRDLSGWGVVMSCLTFFPLIYYVIQYQYRYRYPVLWLTFLVGALPITVVAERVWERWSMRFAGAAGRSEVQAH